MAKSRYVGLSVGLGILIAVGIVVAYLYAGTPVVSGPSLVVAAVAGAILVPVAARRSKFGKRYPGTAVLLGAMMVLAVFGATRIAPSVPTGEFMNLQVIGVNGYMRGTSDGGNSIGYSQSGYLYIPGENGVMIRAYVQSGNVKYVNSSWLGWQQVGNTSISTTKYYFTFQLLEWTANTCYDLMPTGTGTATLNQYSWYRHGLFGDVIDQRQSYLSINYLTVPGNWYDRLNTAFYLDAEIQFNCDPTAFGQGLDLTFDNTTGTYSAVGFSITGMTMNADPVVASTGGVVTQPSIVYNTETHKVTTATGTEVTGGSSTSGSVSTDNSQDYAPSNINSAMYAADGSSDHFSIATSSGTASNGTAQYQSLLGEGMPVTLYSNDTDTIVDYSQVPIRGVVPFLLQPQVSIDRTQYSYKNWIVQSWDVFLAAGTTSASYTTLNPSYITKVGVKNVWAIQQYVVGITAATNYTFRPNDSDYSGNVTAPSVDGLDGSLDPLPTNYVSAAGGTIDAPNLFSGIGDFLAGFMVWIIAGAIAIVVVIIVVKVAFRRK